VAKSAIGQVWGYVRSERKLWLVPVLALLLAAAALLVLGEGSALAPFIYTIF
jgi:hypothetical protein